MKTFILFLTLLSVFVCYARSAVYICSVVGDHKPAAQNKRETNEDDAIRIDHLDLNFTHPAFSVSGTADNLTVYGLTTFELLDDLILYPLTKNLTIVHFPNITLLGVYDIFGNIGELFNIFGAGNFWMKMFDFRVHFRNLTTAGRIDERHEDCLQVDLLVSLDTVENDFENLMDDPELGELINGAISVMAAESVAVLWDEIKSGLEGPLQEWIDEFLRSRNVTKKYEIVHVKSPENEEEKLEIFTPKVKRIIQEVHRKIEENKLKQLKL